mmetsp:Transcript_28642/g.61623  ORF Transcript_28642/g.61623 Transcript_28642/m.61623 type:complete len:180 (-) Transcript_28642:378-917(-)
MSPRAGCTVKLGTLIVPTSSLGLCVVERLLLYQSTGHLDAQTHRLYAVRGFPDQNFMAHPMPMEWLDFNGPLPHMSTRTCAFRTTRAGAFDGIHLHLVVDLDGVAAIDVYRERTTWTCTYVRLLDAANAVWMPAGAVIELVCVVDASTHCPCYTIRAAVSRDGVEPLMHVAGFSWRGDG